MMERLTPIGKNQQKDSLRGNRAAMIEYLKAEVLREIRPQLHKIKQEMVESIRKELLQEWSNSMAAQQQDIGAEYQENSENKDTVRIIPIGLPKKVDDGQDYSRWDYRNKESARLEINTSCIINDFRYKINDVYDGEAYVSCCFSGIKTYDNKGKNATSPCEFLYKLMAQDGTVIDSSCELTGHVKVNEKFCTGEISLFVAPGVYTITVEDSLS